MEPCHKQVDGYVEKELSAKCGHLASSFQNLKESPDKGITSSRTLNHKALVR